MQRPTERKPLLGVGRYGFAAMVLLLGIFGTFLRLYLQNDQIPLNDEWHGLLYASAHSFFYLLDNISFTATCPPLNAYRWILLHFLGWSELWLVIPSLSCGIAALFLFPLLVKRVHGGAVALVFSALLAISPVLVYYSRVARPYSLLVFLVFFSIYASGYWLLTNKQRYLWLYVFSATLAVYFHPVAVVSIFLPLAAGGMCALFRKRLSKHFSVPKIRPSLSAIALTGVLLVVSSAIALLPSWGVSTGVMGKNPFPSLEIWGEVLLMLFGTSSRLIAVVLFCLGIIGAIILLQQNLFWGTLFILLWLLHILMIAVSGIVYVDVPIVLARYLIVLFPVSFLWVAVAVERLVSLILKRTPSVGTLLTPALAVLLVVPLLFTSPLRETYKAPNNFTNHSAFHESYDLDKRRHPYHSTMFPEYCVGLLTTVPAFYGTLPEKTRCLIEYPMMLGDHYNYYYYYQQFHRKRIIAGYTDRALLPEKKNDVVFGNYIIDQVLSSVTDKSRVRFRNMVDILDREAVRRTEADFLIVHRNLMKEFFPGQSDTDSSRTPNWKTCIDCLRKQYGPPVYEDDVMLVFAPNGEERKARR